MLMAKIHIGLVSENKNLENEIKQSAEQLGGAYVHYSRNVLELSQKSATDKSQLIILDLPSAGEGSEVGSLLTFLRSKKDLQNLPIILLTTPARFEVAFLLLDSKLRCFPKASGLFFPLLSIAPLLQPDSLATGTLTKQWVESEFLVSLSGQVGQNTQFHIQEPTAKERRRPFFCQQSEEVRTHLGWFKFTVRMLEQSMDSLTKLFKGMTPEMIEEMSTVLLSRVIDDFKIKAQNDLSTRGAVYLPPTDQMNPQERRWVLSQVKNYGSLFTSPDCDILLEVSQYI